MRRVLPPIWFLAALVAMPALHFLWPMGRYLDFPVNLLGLVPLALGIGLNVVADNQFKKHQTTVKPFQVSSALVTAFPFSFSRNPMYLGVTSMLVGAALFFGTWSSLLPVAAFAADAHALVILDSRPGARGRVPGAL